MENLTGLSQLRDVIKSLIADNRLSDAETICYYLLNTLVIVPQDIRLLRAIVLVRRDLILEALDELMVASQTQAIQVSDTIVNFVLVAAIERQNAAVNSKEIEAAFQITSRLVSIFPEHPPFLNAIKVLSEMRDADQRIIELDKIQAEYTALLESLNKVKQSDFKQLELTKRLEIFQHPLDSERSLGYRLDNAWSALSILLLDKMSADSKLTAQKLISAAPPPYPIDFKIDRADLEKRFDQFYRLSFKSVRMDDIFDQPRITESSNSLKYYYPSDGRYLDLNGISIIAKNLGANSLFFCAGSEKYFERYAASYIGSIIESNEPSAMIVVCATGGWAPLDIIANKLKIKHPRLIICTDTTSKALPNQLIYHTSDLDGVVDYPYTNGLGCYYAMVGWFAAEELLKVLALPIFMTGIDTIVKHNINGIIEKHSGADVVLNKIPNATHGSSMFINTLVLIFPTLYGRQFASFLMRYSLSGLKSIQQPFAYDQLVLTLAWHHITTTDAKIELFDEYDINNGMFNVHNIDAHLELLKKYTFLNIFSAGQGQNAIDPNTLLQ